MKRVFLLFGIVAFSAASAQQKELFDIQEHLRKKMADDKKIVEKKFPSLPFNSPFSFKVPAIGNKTPGSYVLPNGDQVILLSMDRMPCVQPDMQQLGVMPNPAYDRPFHYSPLRLQTGQIPNGSLPYRMIASN